MFRKRLFKKEGKCPLDVACMLIFHKQNASLISQNLTYLYSHLLKKDARINLTRKRIKISASERIYAKGMENYFH